MRTFCDVAAFASSSCANILDAMKKVWGDRLTTVFPQQGHYATDPEILKTYPHGDIQLAHIGDLMNYSRVDLMK
jgi:hypothetical protein